MTAEQINNFNQLIEKLEEINLLEHVEFIGSWATFLYQQYFNDDLFVPELRTRDIDLLYPNIRKPAHQVDLREALSEIGFEAYQDRQSGVTRFFKDGEFELEFLVQEKGSGGVSAYTINALNIKAEGLRNMEILINHSMYIYLAENRKVIVPRPAAFILHKMVINHSRKPEEKREKDIRSAEYLLSYIRNKEEQIADLNRIYDDLTKRQKGYVQDSFDLFMDSSLKKVILQSGFTGRQTPAATRSTPKAEP